MTTDNVLVQRLIKHYNPYRPLGISKKRFLAGKFRPRAKFIPDNDRDDKIAKDLNWHYGRVAHFVNAIRKGHKIEKIEVDMKWHNSWCCGLDVLDGHHRLCAADIAGAERIPASVGGIVDIIEWLAGIHDNAPEF